MTDIETAIMIKNAVREGMKKYAVKNSTHRVEYVKDGLNKSKSFDTYEDAEEWAKSQGLKKGNPHGSGSTKEYRITQ